MKLLKYWQTEKLGEFILKALPNWGGLILGLIIAVWYIYGFIRLSRKEKAIFELKDRIDNLEDTILKKVRKFLVDQNQLNKMVEKDKKPLIAKLERLQMERQFIIDKLPLVGFFKK